MRLISCLSCCLNITYILGVTQVNLAVSSSFPVCSQFIVDRDKWTINCISISMLKLFNCAVILKGNSEM